MTDVNPTKNQYFFFQKFKIFSIFSFRGDFSQVLRRNFSTELFDCCSPSMIYPCSSIIESICQFSFQLKLVQSNGLTNIHRLFLRQSFSSFQHRTKRNVSLLSFGWRFGLSLDFVFRHRSRKNETKIVKKLVFNLSILFHSSSSMSNDIFSNRIFKKIFVEVTWQQMSEENSWKRKFLFE